MNRYIKVLEAAERLLLKSGQPRLRNGTAIDIRCIVREFCKFDLAEIPDLNLDGPLLGAFLPQYDVVMLKSNCIESRKRFTIAHELGHAQLEHDYGSADSLFPIEVPQFFRCEDSDIVGGDAKPKARSLSEVLANKFAAYVLMPESLVREVWRKHRDIGSCADAMLVSQEALTYRLQDLRLT